MHDLNYLWTLVAFAVGGLAGFQAIYLRFPSSPISATFTLPGSFYLLSRGALPALLFFALYYQRLIASNLFWYALASGTGWEAVLRSQFLLKQTAKEGGRIDDLVKGPLDLLRWYQDIFLGAIDTRNARASLEFVKKHLPQGDFKTLCERVRTNAENFQTAIPKLEEALVKLEREFSADTSTQKESTYRLKLGFTVRRIAGKESFKTLFG